MSGLELAREVRKISKDVKIVLVGSFEITLPEFNKVLPSIKVDALLDKPIRLEKVNAVIKALTKQRSQFGLTSVGDPMQDRFF